MSLLELTKPLAAFDIESTGTNSRLDRIIEIAIVKQMPYGMSSSYIFRVNPGIHIPEETTAIHGIYDEDVKDCKSFKEIADEIQTILDDCDLAGYNLLKFDIPILQEEFDRVGKKFEIDTRKVVDAQRIFHTKEPRTLTAALKFYCDEELINAHGAEADTIATLKVIEGQLAMYEDLPRDVAGLDEYSNPKDPTWADRSGRLKWNSDGELIVNFSKKKGLTVKQLLTQEKSFLKWIVKNDFPKDMRTIISDILDHDVWPEAPEKVEEAPKKIEEKPKS
jgi:DNA polymerase-3 subunit epsilon